MKVTARTTVVLALCLAMLGLPLLPDGALRALRVTEQRVDLAFAADGEGAWISAPVTGASTIAGLTWEPDVVPPAMAEVRLRVDGDWGPWEELHTDDEHAPDPGTAERAEGRDGTAPILVEGAEALQFRVEGAATPAGLAADLVEVRDPDAARRLRERPSTASAAPGRPAIHPRSDWGGDSCPGPDRDPIEYGDRVQVLFVHHTAGHVGYSANQVPAIIRAICSYHVNSRGWDDIGYNALVDRFGGLWEGRAGGIERAVIGAHTAGFNSHSTGISIIGHHDRSTADGGSGALTPATEEALARYAAWKLDVHNLDPNGHAELVSHGSSRWSEGTVVRLGTISGHRDASYTACPGRYCYARFDPLRARVDELGGFRIFGGWPQASTMEFRDDGTWQQPTFTFRTSSPADWTLRVRGDAGQVLHLATGRADGDVTVTWDALVNGRPAPKGAYTVEITALRLADGAGARPAQHAFELGGGIGHFEDVSRSNVFHDAITWLAVRRITTGCNQPSLTRFCPAQDVTRAQMAAFLVRALDLPPGDVTFTDVPASHTHAAAIGTLAASGITQGCNPPDNDEFCPQDPVTRAQMASFLARALELEPAAQHFIDVPTTETHAHAIGALAASGITLGCNPPDNDRYCPRATVTRQQMAGFLSRALP